MWPWWQHKSRNFPVVQWLRLLDSNAGDVDLILGWGTRNHMPGWWPKQNRTTPQSILLKLWVSFPEPGSRCRQAWLLLAPTWTSVSSPLLDSGGSRHSLSPDLFLLSPSHLLLSSHPPLPSVAFLCLPFSQGLLWLHVGVTWLIHDMLPISRSLT